MSSRYTSSELLICSINIRGCINYRKFGTAIPVNKLVLATIAEAKENLIEKNLQKSIKIIIRSWHFMRDEYSASW